MADESHARHSEEVVPPDAVGKKPRGGIGSLVVAIINIAGVSVFLVLGYMGRNAATTSDTMALVSGLGLCCAPAVSLLGIVLGVVALLRPVRNRGYAIAGLVLNVLTAVFLVVSVFIPITHLSVR